jgi:putative tryptophan/tyrosine transport system substrate-binding protein
MLSWAPWLAQAMQFDQLKRRKFIVLLGGAAGAWPLAARAQQPMPVIGFLNQGFAKPSAYLGDAFRKGLGEFGYFEGQNVTIEYRWAEGDYARLPELVADLVNRKVDVLTSAFLPATLAAKSATSTIPICFVTGVDPVKERLVTSLNRPGGNITGVAFFSSVVGAKRLGILYDLLPAASIFAVLVNPGNPSAEVVSTDVSAAARTLGKQTLVLAASTPNELDREMVILVQQRADALIVAPDAFFDSQRDRIVSLVAHHAIPTIYERRETVLAGGLMSYEASVADAYHQAGIYTGRILKGERPGDLPVLQPTRLEVVINMKTAKSLGLTFPPGLLAIVDEVVE